MRSEIAKRNKRAREYSRKVLVDKIIKRGKIALILLFSVGAIGVVGNSEIAEFTQPATEYSMTTMCRSINYTQDILTLEDFNGNLWEFQGRGQIDLGDMVSVIMTDNGTPDYIYDDKIKSVNYCGNMEMWGLRNGN